ncbi:MAG: aspartate aminotransferase family protein [Hyphomicrobiaceae bacterium]
MSAVLGTYARQDLVFERGEGVHLITKDGQRYLDFGAGIAVNALGHAHPHLVAALTEQAHKVWHTSNLYKIAGQERLAERLCANSFADKVFFTNSGAEAMECAIKMARRYQHGAGHPERYRIITFEGSFHGRTLATIAAANQKKHLEGFGPRVEGFDTLPDLDADLVRKAITPETAAILIEPIQGEGGIRVAAPKFLQELRRIADENGLLLILDEIQCGVGRTGKLFAHEKAGITPDIMGIAKGIGGGFPVGACLATEAASKAMTAGSHGSTFGGNPLAMAVGNAVLDIILEKGFLEAVTEKGLFAKQQLAALRDTYPDIIEEVRGDGLMLGLKCRVPNSELISAMLGEHLLAVPGGDNVVRILPPLIVSTDDIRDAVSSIGRAAGKLRQAAKTAKAG